MAISQNGYLNLKGAYSKLQFLTEAKSFFKECYSDQKNKICNRNFCYSSPEDVGAASNFSPQYGYLNLKGVYSKLQFLTETISFFKICNSDHLKK